MIRYALECGECEAGFEAWFASSGAFDRLREAGQLECAHCGGHDVRKAIMAPAVASSTRREPPDPARMMAAFAARAREHVAKNFDYVGERFFSEALAMHRGETGERPIWGATTQAEREALEAEGVPAAPLPEPFVPPVPPASDEIN